jgi:hypothetical protein
MHIHLVKLKPQARQELQKLRNDQVENLLQVWNAAKQSAKEQQLQDYGVLVMRNASGTFNVVLTVESPGKIYTEYVCDRP